MQEIRTRSPGRTLRTSPPVSTTVPTASWPRTRPGVTSGTSPLMMCRSVPQMVTASTRTTASAASLMPGSGTSCQAVCPGPWKTSAFMTSPLCSCLVQYGSPSGWPVGYAVRMGRTVPLPGRSGPCRVPGPVRHGFCRHCGLHGPIPTSAHRHPRRDRLRDSARIRRSPKAGVPFRRPGRRHRGMARYCRRADSGSGTKQPASCLRARKHADPGAHPASHAWAGGHSAGASVRMIVTGHGAWWATC